MPDGWAEPYAALAEEMGFPVVDVDDAAAQVREFIDKIDSALGVVGVVPNAR